MNISTIDSDKAKAVVSNATPKPPSKPSMAASGELTRVSGERSPKAIVMPITVPRNPSMGMAQTTMRHEGVSLVLPRLADIRQVLQLLIQAVGRALADHVIQRVAQRRTRCERRSPPDNSSSAASIRGALSSGLPTLASPNS